MTADGLGARAGEALEDVEGAGHRHPGAGGGRAGVDLLRGLDEEGAGDDAGLEAAAEAFPEVGGPEQELAVRRGGVEGGGVALGHEAVGAEQVLELAEAVGAAVAEGGDVPPRPEAGAVGDDEDDAAAGGEDAPISESSASGLSLVSRPWPTISRSTLAASIGQRVSSQRTQQLGSAAGQGMTPCGPGISASTRAASARKGRSSGTAKP